jgi:hypothetical protein
MAEHGKSSVEPVVVLRDGAVDERTSCRILISLLDFLEVRLQSCQRHKRLADKFPLKEDAVERVSGLVKQIHVESTKSLLIVGSSNVGCRPFEGAENRRVSCNVGNNLKRICRIAQNVGRKQRVKVRKQSVVYVVHLAQVGLGGVE